MSVHKHFIPFSAPERDRLTSVREGETKLGQALPCPVLSGSSISPLDLAAIASQGVRYVVIGIPEDIGVRANGGRPGASEGWSAFLSAFLNLQANQFIDPTTVMILGTVETADLMQRASAFAGSGPDDVRQLRSLCAEIDSRVAPLVRMIVEGSLEPIVIGGGHNNSYPLIRGCVEALRSRGVQNDITCINCDAHLDFRRVEGRHSGNGFTYAHQDGCLADYRVLGIHEGVIGVEAEQRFASAQFRHRSYDEIFVRRQVSWQDAVSESALGLADGVRRIGIEVDLDVIADMPSSATSPSGVSVEDALSFVHYMASRCQCVYAHFAEGAPSLGADGERRVGRVLASLVEGYIKARESFVSPRSVGP